MVTRRRAITRCSSIASRRKRCETSASTPASRTAACTSMSHRRRFSSRSRTVARASSPTTPPVAVGWVSSAWPNAHASPTVGSRSGHVPAKGRPCGPSFPDSLTERAVQRRPSVLIADDHPLVSHGLRELLRATYTVVGTVGDGREVHDAVERLKPDVLLLDLSMPHRNGLELIPELVAAFPMLRILVVTMHVDRTMADLALQGGAHGFIPKGASADELTSAIRNVLAGERYISPKIP